jgi:beta-barrel assembly-enhancing protease
VADRIGPVSAPAASPGARLAAMRWVRRCALLLFGILVLTGCVTEEQEQRLGDAIAADVNPQLPLVRDPIVLLYVNRLGLRIAQVSERPDVPYRFYVINSAVINAFALPGGHIYVTRGLLERTENVAELSGVLAHEVAHVAARHGAHALQRELRTGSVVSMLYQLFFRWEPEILDREALQIGRRIWFAQHSRRAEREADRMAVRYMIEVGVDPQGMLTMLEGLLHEEAEDPQPAVEWFSTHPTTEERLTLLNRKIAQIEAEMPPDLAEDIASFPAFNRRVSALPPPPDLFFR